MAASDLTKISMNETYSITPPEIASATASTICCGMLLKQCGKKTSAPPTEVARPAPMLTPIAGSILSVHAHAIGASHGPLVELDISDRVWFAGGIGRDAMDF
jgi:hypothetical protein